MNQNMNCGVPIGPGSQPGESDGSELDYLQMPEGMSTFRSPALPERDELGDVTAGLALLEQLLVDLQQWVEGARNKVLDLSRLGTDDRELVNQVLGEGEVSIRLRNPADSRIQESVLAGVWRVQGLDDHGEVVSDSIELGRVPDCVSRDAFLGAAERVDESADAASEPMLNGPSILQELALKQAEYRPANAPHVINLSLLPHSPEDLEFLDRQLGEGRVDILSRGYGNCRIRSSGTRGIWWVQFFNSTDAIILNTIELCQVPAVACASIEDIQDSAQRLQEILEVYR